MNNPIIDIKNLYREYKKNEGIGKKTGKTIALDRINLEIKKGEIFGLLGPNGAGKSTLMKILSTILLQNSGSAKILGYSVENEENKIRPLINLITGSERNLYWRLTARENLTYFADLYKLSNLEKEKRINFLLNLVGLSERADEKVETFSKGMKQRLQIARGLINDPEILLLDEPTLGLDIITAKELRKIIKELSLLGKTIIFTTHYMYEAEEVCDRIAFIDKGKIVKIGTVKELSSLFPFKNNIKIILRIKEENCDNIHNHFVTEKINWTKNEEEHSINIYTNNCMDSLKKIFTFFKEEDITNISILNITLEDIYLKVLGEYYE